ncbi:hypothetical protein EDD11_004689 [Mortierella claussenii]|nr:hypothetical protein EDD11_004689 [Mortierella claussenii]
MLKYVKDGALELLASSLPASLLQSIRQVSEDDLFKSQVTHKQPLPRRQCHPTVTSATLAKAATRHQRSPQARASDNAQFFLQLDVSSESFHSGPTIQLPYEILALIFQYLPASDMFSVVAVNRLWRQIALLETKQIDLSECFPMDCLGLENDDVYSDFDFVYNLFSMFPLINSLVIKDRYMRDRDLRVVTAGILAGKMVFKAALGPAVGSEAYVNTQQAIAERRKKQLLSQQHLERPEDRPLRGDVTIESGSGMISTNNPASSNTPTTSAAAPPTKLISAKVMRGTIKEELREFSRSVGTYVLIPQTRNTLRKKILERLEHNLEQKEVQEHCWMVENGINPLAFQLFTATNLLSHTTVSSTKEATSAKKHPLVPMTHYRFWGCCFANDWGAAMDVNKLPMIGLAAAISGQGLVVDLEGSYGAPSKSIKTMLGFCFGAHCVLSLDLNFRHTHMELEDVVELLSENPILYKIDIVGSPAYQNLIRLPALRGLGHTMEQMQRACLDMDETNLRSSLEDARRLLRDLKGDIDKEEVDFQSDVEKASSKRLAFFANEINMETLDIAGSATVDSPSIALLLRHVKNNISRPIDSLASQLVFPEDRSASDKQRTASILLKGVIHHGIAGLINTRDHSSGQPLLHTLALKRSYASLAALAMKSPSFSHTTSLSTSLSSSLQPSQSLLSSSLPSAGPSPAMTGEFISASPPSPSLDSDQKRTADQDPPSSSTTSGLSSLISISILPLALTSALSFRRLSLPAMLRVPGANRDSAVGGGSLPTPDVDVDVDVQGNGHTNDGGIFRTLEDTSSYPETMAMMTDNGEENGRLTSMPAATVPASATGSPSSVISGQHPVAVVMRMARLLLENKADPNVYNKDGRSAVVCASYMGFQLMETLLIEHGGHSKELVRIRETM